VKGNESADRLAGMAVVQGDTEMDRTDIPNVLRDNYRISEAAKDSESTTMIRLNEQHVKAGSARRQKYARKQRRIINRHNSVTVSLYTYIRVYSNRNLSNYGCVMCNEDDLTTRLN
jgi:hypothetical protein